MALSIARVQQLSRLPDKLLDLTELRVQLDRVLFGTPGCDRDRHAFALVPWVGHFKRGATEQG